MSEFTSDLRSVERLNADGKSEFFNGFARLKKDDRFRVDDDRSIWHATCDPFMENGRLAVRAFRENGVYVVEIRNEN